MSLRHCVFFLPFLFGQAAQSQDKSADITLQTVKYAGLKDAVAKNRGKVVLVDFWGVT